MKRFHTEWPVIQRRLKLARAYHVPFTRGRARKAPPLASCSPNQHCFLCQANRADVRKDRRRVRHDGRAVIVAALDE